MEIHGAKQTKMALSGKYIEIEGAHTKHAVHIRDVSSLGSFSTVKMIPLVIGIVLLLASITPLVASLNHLFTAMFAKNPSNDYMLLFGIYFLSFFVLALIGGVLILIAFKFKNRSFKLIMKSSYSNASFSKKISIPLIVFKTEEIQAFMDAVHQAQNEL